MSAVVPGSFSTTGRGLRTGHLCVMVTSITSPLPPCLTRISTWLTASSSTRAAAKPAQQCTTSPKTSGGTMILWCFMSSFSYTSPMMVPPVTSMPSRTPASGVKRNLRAMSSAGTSTPSGMKGDCAALSKMACSGRWMPSKMLSMMPGPRSTLSGA